MPVCRLLMIALLPALLIGCGSDQPAKKKTASGENPPKAEAPEAAPQSNPVRAPMNLPQLQPLNTGEKRPLSAESKPATIPVPAGNPTQAVEDPMEQVKQQLMPLQILLGEWEGVTQKVIGGSKALTESSWVWDFQTNPKQPALVMTSNKHPYFKEARLTWLVDDGLFRMNATTVEDVKETYEGDFSVPVMDVDEGEKRKKRTYKLKLTQVEPQAGASELVFNQQNNNRLLLEVYRKRGSSLRRYDTIGISRKGTSIAQLEDDYGDKECIISQGLGTMTVSFKGKTYYVCCSGCKAAFEEDPEKWIAKAEAREKAKNEEQ